ncbi:hypothetical protein GQ600_17979 [Phytophthora cactorum]|nr:hypothetical protein GQ600_17979 [Phytophthora cactorum]
MYFGCVQRPPVPKVPEPNFCFESKVRPTQFPLRCHRTVSDLPPESESSQDTPIADAWNASSAPCPAPISYPSSSGARRKNRSRRRQPASTTVTSSAISSSIVPSLRRAVRVDDRELFRRARRVQRWQDLSRSSDDHTPANLATQGWQWRRQKKGFKLYTRQSPMVNAPIGSQSFSSLLDSEILAVGNVACSISQLAPPLRSPSESEYNSAMHSLYGSDFIHGSLVHKVIFRRRSRTYTTDAEETEDRSNQLLVKTCAYVHTSLFEKKNEQLCYAELFSPTVSGGFRISTCSLAVREVIAGKVRAPLSRALHQLHPFSAWLSAEPARSGVHVVFRARFHRSESDGSFSSKVMNARLWKLAKGMCKLGKLVATVFTMRGD